ncbi:MAG TPA: hypothetical protein VIK45_20865 [Candidatus Dormibacteraeota bacterium]|jgi:hypothetical protein
MKRPTGITILAVIAVIYGIFNLLLALLGLLGSALKASGVAAAAIRYSAGTLAYATISDAVLGILVLAFGIGAFRLKGWAWTTGVAALVLEVVRQIVGIVIQGLSAGTIVRDAITIVIALLLLWYLFRPNVRAAFGATA